jgi:hypothetical protein
MLAMVARTPPRGAVGDYPDNDSSPLAHSFEGRVCEATDDCHRSATYSVLALEHVLGGECLPDD